MLIDWFTVGAQALNFLILVWLMKRFLYKPILTPLMRARSGSPELATLHGYRTRARAAACGLRGIAHVRRRPVGHCVQS
jgi:F-type H+-transporting ATPase subunit b